MNDLVLNLKSVALSLRQGHCLERQQILKDINLNLFSGDVFGVVGRNGSGKTSLFHLIAGFNRPSSGFVEFFGKNPYQNAIRRQIGFLPERPYYPETYTAREFLRLCGKLSLLDSRSIEDQIDHWLNQVGLISFQNKRLKGFSKGMLQRIGIAQALLHSPKLLLLDEPFSGMDHEGKTYLEELFKQAPTRGISILFSEHDPETHRHLAGRWAFLSNGKLEEVLT